MQADPYSTPPGPEPSEGGQPSEEGAEYGARPPTGTRPPAKGRAAAVTAVLVVVILLGAGLGILYAAGIGPFARAPANSGSQASGQTYSQAWAAANGSATAYGTGPWAPLLVAGVDSPSPILESTALPASVFGSSCTGTAVATGTVVTFEGFSGSLSSGEAPNWLFFVVGPSDTVLVMTVVGSQPTIWEKYTGSGCAVLTLAGGLPAKTADSSVVASSFMAHGGSTYAAAHPGGSLTLDAVGAYGVLNWWVDYTTCPPGGSTTSGTYFDDSATFFASNGTLAGSLVPRASSSCSGLNLTGGLSGIGTSIPLRSALSVGAVAGAISGNSAAYSVTVKSAAGGLTWNDLAVSLVDASGTTVQGTALDEVTINATSGCTVATGIVGIAYYGTPTSGGCSGASEGGGALVTAGERVTVLNSAAVTLAGAQFEIAGALTFTGTIEVPLSTATIAETPIGSVLSVGAVVRGTNSLGTYYATNVTKASGGVLWDDVAFEVLNASGRAPNGPYEVNIWAHSGCAIASGSPNSSSYFVPLTGACSSGTGGSAKVLVGDTISIVSAQWLTGTGLEWVGEGENLFDSTIERSINASSGGTTSIQGVLSVTPVVEGNNSAGYYDAVNVTLSTPGLLLEDLTFAINASSGPLVSGPFAVNVYASTGCQIATGGINSTAYSDPTSGACTSQVLGGTAEIVAGDTISILGSVALTGASENFRIEGQNQYSGEIVLPLPITGGPLYNAFAANLPTSGTDSRGYHYTLTVTHASKNLVVADLAATILNHSAGPLAGPYLVNFTASSGCVLATGGINTTAYLAPTFNACGTGTLGAGAAVVAGDSIVIYSTVSLSGTMNWFALFAHGPYVGNEFYEIV